VSVVVFGVIVFVFFLTIIEEMGRRGARERRPTHLQRKRLSRQRAL
jgi:hypothetical protein